MKRVDLLEVSRVLNLGRAIVDNVDRSDSLLSALNDPQVSMRNLKFELSLDRRLDLVDFGEYPDRAAAVVLLDATEIDLIRRLLVHRRKRLEDALESLAGPELSPQV